MYFAETYPETTPEEQARNAAVERRLIRGLAVVACIAVSMIVISLGLV